MNGEVSAQPSSAGYKEAAEALIAVAAQLDGRTIASGDRMELVICGLILRARRFGIAACRLADAGDVGEASPFVRALMEFVVTLRWLLLDPPRHFTIWAIDDLRGRLLIGDAGERLAGVQVLEPGMRDEYVRLRRSFEDEWRQTIGEPVPKRMPSFESRARDTGNQLLYEFAYRFESQTGIHPTPFAVDQMLSRDGDRIRINAEAVDVSYADPYGVVGIALLDMLDAAGDAVGALDFSDQTEPYRAVLGGPNADFSG